ncbi:MFS transporter [Lentzea sp. BCCO 10_0856]|uniref:MFS transporter n=1 Tax=Lentzea miocenica TaxID=3095431 RepID=A0ABU4STA7_9PSEU|nr:MFS transporter [Lentzea sp. BCCO 10_0856]MDX8029141.1 MFS transporter [Lentzea sp. BCCO 10_0856]
MVHDTVRSPSVLRSTQFLRLWTATTASGIATWALPFVLGLAVLSRSLTAVELGILLAARTAGFLAAVPISGVLADRYARRQVVLWSGLISAAAAPVLAVFVGNSLVLAAIAAIAMGAGQGACRPAFSALTAEVVEPDQRQQANAAMTMSIRVTTLVAPGLTALLALVVNTQGLLLGIGALWLAAALMPPAGTGSVAPPSGAGFVTEFLDGVREARRHPWFLAGLGALSAVIATGYSATGVILPLVSRDRYGTEAVLAGALTAYTLGALAGAVLMARWRPRAAGWTGLFGLALYGFAPLVLLLPVHPVVVIAVYAIAGLGIDLFNVPWFTATQREVEPSKLARVSSLDFLMSYGLAPIGLALIAPAVTAYGAGAVLIACSVICFAAPALAALVPSSRDFGTPEKA